MGYLDEYQRNPNVAKKREKQVLAEGCSVGKSKAEKNQNLIQNL